MQADILTRPAAQPRRIRPPDRNSLRQAHPPIGPYYGPFSSPVSFACTEQAIAQDKHRNTIHIVDRRYVLSGAERGGAFASLARPPPGRRVAAAECRAGCVPVDPSPPPSSRPIERSEGEPGPIERRGRVRGLRCGPDVRQREDRAVPDDGPANGSRLCGRCAPLAGMTQGRRLGISDCPAPRGRRWHGRMKARREVMSRAGRYAFWRRVESKRPAPRMAASARSRPGRSPLWPSAARLTGRPGFRMRGTRPPLPRG